MSMKPRMSEAFEPMWMLKIAFWITVVFFTLAFVAVGGFFAVMVGTPFAIGYALFKYAKWQRRMPEQTWKLVEINKELDSQPTFPSAEELAQRIKDDITPFHMEKGVPVGDWGILPATICKYLYEREPFMVPNVPDEIEGNPIEKAEYRTFLRKRAVQLSQPRKILEMYEGASRALTKVLHAITPRYLMLVGKEMEWPASRIIAKPSDCFDLDDVRAKIQDVFKSDETVELFGALPEITKDGINEIQLPVNIPDSTMMEHCLIAAASGWGKTTLIETQILHYIERPDRPSVIVVDSQGDMIARVQRLKALEGRQVILVDPTIATPAANMFVQDADYAMTATAKAELIELFEYILGALRLDLAMRQAGIFGYAAALILACPDPSIYTLLELMEEPTGTTVQTSKFRDIIAKLTPDERKFFETQFFAKTYDATKRQIAARLYTILRIPQFAEMFSGSNKIDFYDAMNEGAIILINTAKDLLHEPGFNLFGRYMIARVLAAAYRRAQIPQDKRRPVFTFVDEAHEYFDDTTSMILAQARKYRLSLTFAVQHLDQLRPEKPTQQDVLTNTSVKFIGDASHFHAGTFANNMGRTPREFIQSVEKDDEGTEYALYLRGLMRSAIKVKVAWKPLDKLLRMSDEAHRRMVAENTVRFGADAPKRAPEPMHTQEPETAKTKW